MLRCYWPQRSGCGYFSPDLEKMKQLLVCSKHRNAWKDNGNVLKVSFSIQGNVTQWKETECSTPFVVTAATSLLLNWLKFIRKAFTFFLIAKLEDFKTMKRRTMNPGNWSLSPSANYAGWSHKQIIEILSGAKVETKICQDTNCNDTLWFLQENSGFVYLCR